MSIEGLSADAADPPQISAPQPRRVWWGKWILFGFIMAWFGLFYLLPHHLDGESGHLIPPAKRQRLADFTLPSLAGPDWTLSQHRGHVVLLNFWATWCPPCREETPGLVQLAQAETGRDFDMAGVAMDSGGMAPVADFVAQYNIPYPILQPGGRPSAADSVDSYPTTLLLDRQGRVAKVYIGATDTSTFQADVTALLAERR